MDLLADLQAETGMGLILITHDLGVVADVADKVAVMYAGKIVETGLVGEVYHRPAHPYTLGLMASIPRVDQKGGRLDPIRGAPPSLIHIPPGCSFHPRCDFARDRCTVDEPPLYEVTGPGAGGDSARRRSACHYYQEVLDAARSARRSPSRD
ncbi:MAG TPA: oligopeptide/dipeptide ABC transporter ATP-binding protein [Egibacteraceae bacterium]|nr:oligopeptide/dipeptide ABC transporter ATP-binding protein [Egibacteraceae bacterium]